MRRQEFKNKLDKINREMLGRVKELERIAKRVRRHIVKMTYLAGSGHPGGSLSIVDVLVVLYFYKMRHNPRNPSWPDRDRLVLSKGHAAPALYAVLAEAGYFPLEDLWSLRTVESGLQGHPDRNKVPGVEVSTGSLGQGLSIANGMALAGKIDKRNYQVYCILGDGELQEGQIWEAAMTSSHFKLDNLTAILDHNKLQLDGPVKDVMNIYPLEEKWRAFGWHVTRVDGHSIPQIMKALDEKGPIGKPRIIIAETIKGKGVSFMENKIEYHGKPPNYDEYRRAMEELSYV